MLSRFSLAGILCIGMTSLANLASAEEGKGWSGEVGLNGARTTGNNDTTDVGFAFKLNNRGSDWRHNLKGTADYGDDYYSEDFGAFKHGYYIGVGAGYSVLIDEPTEWRIEAGAGFRSQKARLTPNDPSGLSSRLEEFTSARLFSDLDHAFDESVKLTNDTELFYSDIDTFFINEVGVNSRMFGDFALRASFRIEAHTDVPEGREKVDTISRIGIVYKME